MSTMVGHTVVGDISRSLLASYLSKRWSGILCKRPSCLQGGLGAIPRKLCSVRLKQVMLMIQEPYINVFSKIYYSRMSIKSRNS